MDLIRFDPVGATFVSFGLIALCIFVILDDRRQSRLIEKHYVNRGIVRDLTESLDHRYYVTLECNNIDTGKHFYVEYVIGEKDYESLEINNSVRIGENWEFVKIMFERSYRFEQWVDQRPLILMIIPLCLLIIPWLWMLGVALW